AVSVIISGVVALTLTPALCALILKPVHAEPRGPFRWFNRFFDRLTRGYLGSVNFLMRRAVLGTVLFLGMIGITAMLFERVPGSLVPDEDQGYVIAVTQLPPAAALSRTRAAMDEFTEQVLAREEVGGMTSFAGYDLLAGALKSYGGAYFITLKDWSERKEPGQDSLSFVQNVLGIGAAIPEANVVAFSPPPITGMSSTGGFEVYVQSRLAAPPEVIEATTRKLVAAANERPELAGVRTTLDTQVPSFDMRVDRAKARALGVPINTVDEAMQSTFGSLYVNDFTLFGRNYQVNLQSEAPFRAGAEDLKQVFVRSNDGHMVPLSSLVEARRGRGPDLIERFNVFPAAKVMGNPAAGF